MDRGICGRFLFLYKNEQIFEKVLKYNLFNGIMSADILLTHCLSGLGG